LPQHGSRKADLFDKKQEQRRDDDTATTRAIESNADGETAAVHEPRAHNRCDHDNAHAGPTKRHENEGGVELPRFRQDQNQK
jgi:hypothetical protein